MGVAREYSDQQVLQMMGRAGRPQVSVGQLGCGGGGGDDEES